MKFKKLLILSFLSITTLSYSQFDDDPGFGGGSGDPATEPVQTPIDGITLPLLITGITVAIILIRKKEKHLKTN